MGTRRFFSDVRSDHHHVIIDGDEFHHVTNVIRSGVGSRLEVVDGRGNLFEGTIRKISGSKAVVEIAREEFREKPDVSVVMGVSLLKKKVMAGLVEKLSEIGVDEIRPIVFSRTEGNWAPSHLEKYQRIAQQSLKVNRLLWCTEIFPPVSLDQFLSRSQGAGTTCLMMDIQSPPLGEISISSPVLSVVGPPGDFVPSEKDKLVENGFVPISINESILRTETAAVSIGAILKSKLMIGSD